MYFDGEMNMTFHDTSTLIWHAIKNLSWKKRTCQHDPLQSVNRNGADLVWMTHSDIHMGRTVASVNQCQDGDIASGTEYPVM